MPVAGNPDGLLNPHQLRALRELEACGWKLHFVLTSIYQKPEVVIINPGRDMVAVLEHDGEVNMTPDLS